VGGTHGRNKLDPSALKGLNIKQVQPLSGLMVRVASKPRVPPVVIQIEPFQGTNAGYTRIEPNDKVNFMKVIHQ
jgi:hypothetical protein